MALTEAQYSHGGTTDIFPATKDRTLTSKNNARECRRNAVTQQYRTEHELLEFTSRTSTKENRRE